MAIEYPDPLPPAPDRTQPGADYATVAKTWAEALTIFSAELEPFALSLVEAASTSNYSATPTHRS